MHATWRIILTISLLSSLLSFAGCSVETGTGSGTRGPSSAAIVLVPTPSSALTVLAGDQVTLGATNNGIPEPMSWAIRAAAAGSGIINSTGVYSAPAMVSSSASITIDGVSLTHPTAGVSIQVALQNAAPSLYAATPAVAAVGTPFHGTLQGATFQPNSVVLLNGQAVASSFISSNTLAFQAAIPPSGQTNLSVQILTPSPGGGVSSTLQIPITPGGMAYDAAARFLEQASWGPTPDSIQHLQQIGFSAYIAEQLAMPVDSLVTDDNFQHFTENLWNLGLVTQSQLRQKTMWTWYRLFNVPLGVRYATLSGPVELLQRDAFANYSTLLYDMSMNTSMGDALTSCCANFAGPSPNQNYGREILQLFSTGPNLLNHDGTPVLDANGSLIAPYTQQDIAEAARAMTALSASPEWLTDFEGITRMGQWSDPSAHDSGSKVVLGQTIAAGGTVSQDMSSLVSITTAHPNTSVYLSVRLIHAFVTSNPSPEYISRIASVWSNDGNGTTGNIGAVLTAILLDPEARLGDDPAAALPDTSGRFLDPIDFTMLVDRILLDNPQTSQASGVANIAACSMGECSFAAPSVFGFYNSAYTLPGTQLLAPEAALYTAPALQVKASYLTDILYLPPGSDQVGSSIDWSPWTSLAIGDGSALVDQINHACLHGTMSPALRSILLQAYSEVPADQSNSQAKRLLYLTFMSPEFAVSR